MISRDHMLKFFQVAGAASGDNELKYDLQPRESATKTSEDAKLAVDTKVEPQSPKNKGKGKAGGQSPKNAGKAKGKGGQQAHLPQSMAFPMPPIDVPRSFMSSFCPLWGPMTMELKDFPPKQTAKTLLNFVNSRLWGAIDFVYVPQSESGSGNAGHAFLNFRSLTHVAQFAAIAHHEGMGSLVNADVYALDKKLEEIRKQIADGPDQGYKPKERAWHPKLVDFQGYHRPIPSGGDLSAAAPPFLSVTQQVASNRELLKHQVEFYFSADNMVKDVYLRSQQDEQGWIPIALIASFPKVRQFLPSVPDIVMIMGASDTVEVDGKAFKLRSKDHELRKKLSSKPSAESTAQPN